MMNQLQFIKSIFGIAATTFVKPPEFLVPKEYTEIYSGFIAGYQYYEGQEIENHFTPGETLSLVREPVNPFDEMAIALHYKGIKIGFIPMIDNTVLTNMIDQEMLLTAKIKTINKKNPTWERVEIGVYI